MYGDRGGNARHQDCTASTLGHEEELVAAAFEDDFSGADHRQGPRRAHLSAEETVGGADLVNGGVFRATAGLQKKFGADRVQDTPLAEGMIAGVSIAVGGDPDSMNVTGMWETLGAYEAIRHKRKGSFRTGRSKHERRCNTTRVYRGRRSGGWQRFDCLRRDYRELGHRHYRKDCERRSFHHSTSLPATHGPDEPVRRVTGVATRSENKSRSPMSGGPGARAGPAADPQAPRPPASRLGACSRRRSPPPRRLTDALTLRDPLDPGRPPR